MYLVILAKLVNLVIPVSGDSGNLTYLMILVILATPTKSQQDKTKRCERYTPRPYSSPMVILVKQVIPLNLVILVNLLMLTILVNLVNLVKLVILVKLVNLSILVKLVNLIKLVILVKLVNLEFWSEL